MELTPKQERLDDILRLIYEGTVTATGNEFFHELVRATAQAMGVKWAFVSEFAGSRDRVRTLAFWDGDDFAENFEYDLDGTVCEGVLTGEIRYYPDNVAPQFPREHALVDMGVESYLAVPMMTPDDEVLGHLAIFDQKAMNYTERELQVFKVFGARAGAELARMQMLESLERSERRLANILETATDAIITINKEHRILLFNAAAERVFCCASNWAIGQPFDRFLTRQFRQFIGQFVDGTPDGKEPAWAPEGITAVCAGGEEFPIEVTMSTLALKDEMLYTFILRDITDRQRAKEEISRLQQDNVSLREEHRRSLGFAEMIGDSPALQAVVEQIKVVAPTDASVLLVGETGTGKELIARALHEYSPRKSKLLICVNCAALPSELVESELFGHEKGAFTGATTERKGRFELANGGTLFLDEVGELPAQTQSKLLRVLQEQSFERIGGTRTLHVDVRLVAATNRDLGSMVSEGDFRADLYYRLNVFPIRIPPLRDRRPDVPLLARHFLERMARKLGRTYRDIDTESIDRLMGYSWPGNVRELQNVIERASILATGPIIKISDMVLSQPPEITPSTPDSGTLDAVQKAHIVETLEQCNWQIEGRRGAAATLGLKPGTLRYRMRKLGISKQARH
jgi:formate hydrogenlyase transcriptional activator